MIKKNFKYWGLSFVITFILLFIEAHLLKVIVNLMLSVAGLEVLGLWFYFLVVSIINFIFGFIKVIKKTNLYDKG